SVPIILALSVFIILILPYSPSLQATNLGFGLIIAFTIISFLPLLMFTSGFATGNKFADISAQRSVLILISYEVPTLIVVAGIAMLSGSYSFQGIIQAQASNFYFAALMPIGLIIFFITMLAEFERPPFDLREADNELIAGWLTDYSSPYYALSLFIDYARMFLGSVLIAILFFGGWLGPILPPIVWLLLKAFIISLFIIMIRATAFRMRIDRILRLGWLWLVPLSLINLIITYIVFVGLPT
ncbi:MAG: NADH-quinone oxidoreductase subunit H, partial [Candidatus Micrarchaeota archaeon]|nr:NADH-quinone oxidoreductase subunit H [Candidatus Micrarchaeota archaeon]